MFARSAELSQLQRMLHPRSVAIIGASEDRKKYGYIIPQYLLEGGFEGKVVLVNPRGGETLGRRFISSLRVCNTPIDLVVTTLPPEKLEGVISDCADAKVAGVVLFTAGLAEAGKAGSELQDRLAQKAKAAGIRLVGPNCLGLFNATSKLNVIASPDIPTGHIGLVTQSGGLAEMFFVEGKRLGGGLSMCVSLGNQADVECHEAVEAMADDPATRVIVVYIEGLRNGRAFVEAVRSATRRKPVVIIKGGRTDAGARTTISHTASLAGSGEVYASVLQDAGAIMVEDLQDLYAVALTLSVAPIAQGPRIAIIGGGGGQATLMADAVERRGLVAPAFPSELQQQLREILIPRSMVANPVEFAGANERSFSAYERCVELIIKQDFIDGVLVYGSFGGFRTDLEDEGNNYATSARAFGELARCYKKPVVVHSSHAGRPLPAFDALREAGIPFMSAPETAARCMAALVQAGERVARGKRTANTRVEASVATCPAATHPRTAPMEFEQAAEILEGYGVPVVPLVPAESTAEAFSAAKRVGYPVVLKLIAPRVSHKTEVGGVITNIATEEELCVAFNRMVAEPRIANAGQPIVVGVAPMVREGVEAVVGAVRDPTFGPLVMVGSGGIYIELFKDVSFSLAGLGKLDAHRLIERTRLHRMLTDWRGRGSLDADGLADIIVAVSRLMLDNPTISEVDLNPVFVSRDSARAADVRIVQATDAADVRARRAK